MAKILIQIGAHICTAPRPQKEADALASAGHDVTVAGVWNDPRLIERDKHLIQDKNWRFIPVVDFSCANFVSNFKERGLRNISQKLYQTLDVFTPQLLGYGAAAHKRFALQEASDLTIVHSESGLWLAGELLKRGLKVGVDFEDWFSEDLTISARKARPVKKLKELERYVGQNSKYCLCTSKAMAKALSEAYQIQEPTVIYNTFPLKDRDSLDGRSLDRKNIQIPSIHWFSHTIGLGRGLELFFEALAELEPIAEVHLRGNYPEHLRQKLEALIPGRWRDYIHIHDLVPNDELLSRISEHDIGLALESKDIPSRDLTVTNKLFQYLLAGLAVVATDTAGQKEVLETCSEAVSFVRSGSASELALILKDLLYNQDKLRAAKAASLKAAKEHYHFERQALLLSELAHKCITEKETMGRM